MPKRKRTPRGSKRTPVIWDGFVVISTALTFGALWFLYRSLEVRNPFALASGALAAGVGLAALLGGVILMLHRAKAGPASIGGVVNIFFGALLLGVALLISWLTPQGAGFGDLLAYGLFFLLFGSLILIFGRLRILERLPL